MNPFLVSSNDPRTGVPGVSRACLTGIFTEPRCDLSFSEVCRYPLSRRERPTGTGKVEPSGSSQLPRPLLTLLLALWLNQRLLLTGRTASSGILSCPPSSACSCACCCFRSRLPKKELGSHLPAFCRSLDGYHFSALNLKRGDCVPDRKGVGPLGSRPCEQRHLRLKLC